MNDMITWTKTEMAAPKDGQTYLGFNEEWRDADFNPEGVRECFLFGDNEWQSAKWCGVHDCWLSDTETRPTYITPRPSFDDAVNGG